MAKVFSSPSERHETLIEALDRGSLNEIRSLLLDVPASDVAHLIEASPPTRRAVIWKLIATENQGDVLQYLNEDIRAEQLSQFDTKDIVQLIDELDNDDFADILQDLPKTVVNQVLEALTDQNRREIEQVLLYDEDTAGGLMDTQFITIRPNLTLETISRYLRMHTELPDNLDALLVVDRKGTLIGRLTINNLLINPPEHYVRDHMETNFDVIKVNTDSSEVATLFERHDLVSAPVVTEAGELVGRITIDDVVDVIRDEASHNLMSMAGLDEESDTFAPVAKTAQKRAVWLGINLITALLASAVISMFEATISKVVYLAAVMPIVASMGGIAGSQTLTLVIRSIALGHLSGSNWVYLLSREAGVAAINGLLWAVLVGALTTFWFNDFILGSILGAALIVNLLVAAVVGALLPIGLEKVGIDPALAGSVILTTVTDVIGFIAFLGLATICYM